MEASIVSKERASRFDREEAPASPRTNTIQNRPRVRFQRIGREKDIIIKCKLAEMVKCFFKEYVIIWHDPNLSSLENQRYLVHFVERFCKIKTFTEWDKALIEIRGTNKICHVITSGTNGELLVREIASNDNVSNIYVFCENKDYHTTWTKSYPKISCVETKISDVLDKIQQKLLEWYKKESSLKFNFPAFAPFFNDTHKSEMNHLHRFLKVIPKFKNRTQAKNDFIRLSREIYSDRFNIKHLKDFEQNYNFYSRESILKWYTRESFLYRVTNKCLRIATSDSIQYCRLPLRDMQRAIKEQYLLKSKDFNGLLYRGTILSEKEWSDLKDNLGREIEMHGFLSTSKNKGIALNYLEDLSKDKVMITIIVPKGPNDEEQGFAEIEEFSRFPHEKEVLFNVRSRFTVLETEEKYSEDLPCRHLVLLYGAQGLRELVAWENPVQEVSIPEEISCTHCEVPSYHLSEKILYVPLTDLNNPRYFCQECLPHFIELDPTPLLCVPFIDNQKYSNKTEITGYVLTNRISKIPFYGYQCAKCQIRKKDFYFVCLQCNKEMNKWCSDCFENTSKCIRLGHTVIFESSPFSFWFEEMSRNELKHLWSQKYSVSDYALFPQADMYFKCHEYKKAIKYYKIEIRKNEGKNRDERLESCFTKIGIIYTSQGEHQKALKYFLKSLDLGKLIYGDNCPEVAASYGNLAVVYERQGKYEISLEYNFKILKIYESASRNNYFEVSAAYHTIANIYSSQKKYDDALKYYYSSLDIKKLLYGDNRPEVAVSYCNIAVVYAQQENYEKALEYNLKALDIKKVVYGDKHPDVAACYSNLGVIYKSQGEEKIALENLMKSLEIYQSIFGENQDEVSGCYYNLANLHLDRKEDDKALEYFFKCLDIRKLVHGDNHPFLVEPCIHMAKIFQTQKKYEQALEYHLKALKIDGINCDHQAISYGDIASIYQEQGESNKCLENLFKCVELKKSIHGENDQTIAIIYSGIASVYHDQGEYKKALEYHFKCLDIRKLVCDDISDLASSYIDIARLYKDQGEEESALEYFKEALEIQISVYGNNHETVERTSLNIGSIYEDRGEYTSALEYYFKGLEIRESIEGNNHQVIEMISTKIARLYQNQKENSLALEYFMKAQESQISVYGNNHHSVVMSSLEIACTLQFQEEYIEALEYLLKALGIQESIDGNNYHLLAIIYREVANMYKKLGEEKMALEYKFKCLETRKAGCGDNHLTVADSYAGIAETYLDQKEYEKAREYYLKGLEIMELVDEDNHPKIAGYYYNIGMTFSNQKE